LHDQSEGFPQIGELWEPGGESFVGISHDAAEASYNFPMRRPWVWLAAIGGAAVLSGVALLMPARDDGLDWMRKYGARETVHTWFAHRSFGQVTCTSNLFHFRGPIPPEVKSGVAQFAKSRTARNNDNDEQFVALNPVMNEVYFIRAKGSWLEYEWFWLKKRLGMRSLPRRSKA